MSDEVREEVCNGFLQRYVEDTTFCSVYASNLHLIKAKSGDLSEFNIAPVDGPVVEPKNLNIHLLNFPLRIPLDVV